MARQLLTAVRTAAATLALTGLVYPLAVTGAARLVFPWRSGGSLVSDERGRVVGSELLGQSFGHPAYFHPRPSAAGDGYDGAASGGSNLGPTSRRLRERAEAGAAKLRAENPGAPPQVPVELVAASASGLDPHVGFDAARWQVRRVARARGVSEERIDAVVASTVEARSLGVLGEPRINVLLLNLALDRRLGAPAGTAAPRAAPGPP